MSSVEKREALRRELLSEIPAWYRPWVHLAVPTTFGLAIVAAALMMLEDLTAWELVAIPATFIFANTVEWFAHRDLLHTRTWYAPVLYDQHTPRHHMLYTTDAMEIRDRREFRLVLIPAYGIMLIFLTTAPIVGGLLWFGLPNLAALFVATSMLYTVSYEWLHLSYHLGSDTWIGRRRIIAFLRNHHAVHHDLRLMQRYNFNVTIPFFDWLRGTVYREEAAGEAEAVSG